MDAARLRLFDGEREIEVSDATFEVRGMSLCVTATLAEKGTVTAYELLVDDVPIASERLESPTPEGTEKVGLSLDLA